MSQPGTQNIWAEINGGLRGSTLLKLGAVTTILATLQLFAAGFFPQASDLLINSAWLCWIMALWLLAAGFFWIGVQPIMGRFGLVVGSFHFLAGLFLFLVIFVGMKPFVSNVSLSIGRTLSLLIFVRMEKKHLKAFTFRALVSVAFLQFLKISLRITEMLPPLDKIGNSALDSSILILLSLAIIQMAKDITNAENSWAIEELGTKASGFGEFNNPEHNWNQNSD